METAGPVWFVELVEAYFRSLARRGRQTGPAGATRRTYTSALSNLGRFLEARGLNRSELLTKRDLEDWLDERLNQLTPASQMVAAAAVRGVLLYAAREDVPLSSPTLFLKVETMKHEPNQPKPLERLDLDRLLLALAPLPPDLARRRDRALVLFLFITGSRVAAATRIRRDELRADYTVDVVQKGGRFHRLVYGATTASWILDYLALRQDSSPWLWVSHVPGRVPQQLGGDEVRQLLGNMARRVGIPQFTTHQLRHSCGTEAMELGANEREAAAILGHANLATIAGYTKIRLPRRRELALQLEQLVPVAPRPPGPLKPISRRHRRAVA